MGVGGCEGAERGIRASASAGTIWKAECAQRAAEAKALKAKVAEPYATRPAPWWL